MPSLRGTEVKRENLLAHTTESPTVDLGLRVAKSKAEVLSLISQVTLFSMGSAFLCIGFCLMQTVMAETIRTIVLHCDSEQTSVKCATSFISIPVTPRHVNICVNDHA